MENLSFKITEQDVSNYLIQHNNDYAIKNKEAMFVKYIKESNEITQEILEILVSKYNWNNQLFRNTYDSTDVLKESSLYSFDTYLKTRDLDISGICHILIPTFGYYGFYKENYHPIIASHIELYTIVSNVIGKTAENDYRGCLNLAIDNYYEVGKIDECSDSRYTLYMKIKMDTETCRKELVEYSKIYGEEPVQRIKKIIQERK